MSTITVIDNPSHTIVVPQEIGFVLGDGGSGGALSFTPITRTTNYTILSTDTLVFANANTAGFTLTLPTAVGFTSLLAIIATTTNVNLVTLKPFGAQTIAGASSLTIGTVASDAPYKGVTLVSDNTNWWLM